MDKADLWCLCRVSPFEGAVYQSLALESQLLSEEMDVKTPLWTSLHLYFFFPCFAYVCLNTFLLFKPTSISLNRLLALKYLVL